MNLDALDRLHPSDLRSEVARRLHDARPSRPIPDPPRVGRRVTAGVVAIAVFAAAAYVGVVALVPEPEPPRREPWGGYGEGWSELPPPPEWRDGAAIVWTGEELLYLGGTPRGEEDGRPLADGYAFAPASGGWRSIPAAPWPGTNGHAVWTGDEALVYGAESGRGEEAAPVAFDPATDTWRELSPSPMSPSWGGTSVWTGSELLVIGGGDQGSASTSEGSALDPATDSWRPLPPAPAGVNLAGSVWTGEEAVVVGSAIDRGNHAETRTSIAMSYTPGTDSWRRLADPPVSAQTADVAFVGGRLIAWELYSPAAAEYLPDEERWRSIETGPVDGGECYAQGATVGDALFSWDCGSPAALFGEASSFRYVDRPLEVPELYGWGSVFDAGPVAIVEHIETVMRGGTPYVGSPDAPVHLWAWRPPDDPPPLAWTPTADDAENLVGEFLADWYPGSEVYLPTMATSDVIERNRVGAGGLVALEGWTVHTWNSYRGVEVEPGVFEVRIGLRREGEVFATEVFTVGPGITADGRDGVLVIADTRPA